MYLEIAIENYPMNQNCKMKARISMTPRNKQKYQLEKHKNLNIPK